MKSVSDQKSELRARMLKLRKSIDEEDWQARSETIINELKKIPEFINSDVIHCYVSMNDRKEVNTHSLLNDLISSGKKVIVPVTDFETGELKHSELRSFEDLKKNKWGVPEPDEIHPQKQKTDLILVPLLAADKDFNRLGYGKGFYDRFLKKENAVKIGLLFDEFILDQIPVENFDEKLDILITEKMILRCNNSDLGS
ncbi:MAG: 5-formyltetrahydrofolate cyclo-ligase [Balneola sp.]|nr:5-formyltetrahydrofolate cyclo-ligase [Balneola sp.]MBO6650136.1 5-formyltetrahydrofolate cyclo-ligase [Balneola sp.]MBO6710499.1 5-formyltetrahydrofolate cyclo-ligase [Balneola sp.]MBO6799184.1 5-formyltetrahydrofolate cyclo-ligase [Balneola sp.]MBO6871023.1 5-formyltetrahydrofolate cyclo-ligase [Balneola sp.]